MKRHTINAKKGTKEAKTLQNFILFKNLFKKICLIQKKPIYLPQFTQ